MKSEIKIYPLKMQPGVSYGSGALKSLQNDDIPEIDLLVREAIQNSSDAAISVKDKDTCRIIFNLGTFSTTDLNEYIPEIATSLSHRFPASRADYIEIRDTNTTGLTGPVRVADLDPEDHGNYFKLVFDTGKEQSNSSSGEAGGSWGYGKSVYYRVGTGLVLFYSRVKVNASEYESRLIFSLVENENDPQALLKSAYPESVGRAWWGIRNENEVLPITDEDTISNVLDIFGVSKFGESRTGTSIIIPYIEKDKLLAGVFPDSCGVDPDEIAMCDYKNDLAKYIELAVQKWYAPRLNNFRLKEYSGQKALDIRISSGPDDVPVSLRFENMRPLFQLIQELYTTAVSANKDADNIYKSGLFPQIKCRRIPSNALIPAFAGYISAIRVPKSALYPTGSGVSPHTYLRLFGKHAVNDPIVMFGRTPGLVLDYKIDGKWIKGLHSPADDGTYELVFFVPRCDSILKLDVKDNYAGKPFGEYLRSREKSDHMDWTDSAKVRIIANIQSQIISKCNEIYNEEDCVPVESAASRLSGLLGRKLGLRAMKKTSGGGGGGGGGGSSYKATNLDMTFTRPQFVGSKAIEVTFTLKFKNNRRKANIGLYVETATASSFDATTWRNKIETSFPLRIEKIYLCETNGEPTGNVAVPISGECTDSCPVICNEDTRITMSKNGFGDIVGFSVENYGDRATVSGVARISSADRKYSCLLKEASSGGEQS